MRILRFIVSLSAAAAILGGGVAFAAAPAASASPACFSGNCTVDW
ncbi:hypothetical protein [Kutzneria sp. NPDC051319]